jgi:ubiquinone/menaquinone biosynthesis C-methylase UbiE
LFARAYHRLARAMERELAARRRELLSGLSGRVLEVGAGNGMNFGHYPGAVEEVVAVEPEPYLRARAQSATQTASVRVVVQDAVADELPHDASSFDAVVACLVLCSVPDPEHALAELRRVLKSDGELRFLEHVRSSSSRKARIQDTLDRRGIWPKMAGGCHCARDTVGAMTSGGFAIEQFRDIDLGPSWLHTNPHVLGIARAPND